MVEFKLPDVGEGIFEAEILEWLVKEGDTVEMDQTILEIQTDKAVVEIPSPITGTIQRIVAQPGVMANVGDVLVVILPKGESATAAPPAPSPPLVATPSTTPLPDRPSAPATPAFKQQPPSNGKSAKLMSPQVGIASAGNRILAAPAVRKLALEMNIDLAQVPGTGPAGRVLLSDLKNYTPQATPVPQPTPLASAPPPVAPPPAPVVPTAPQKPILPPPAHISTEEIVDEEPLRGLRRRIAERMEEAWRVPHVTTFREIDVNDLVKVRKSLKVEAEQRNISLTFMPFFIKAATLALRDFPYFNASLDMENQKILVRKYYHIGIATAIADGLVVPVIKHANQLSILEIAAELTRLRTLAESRRLAADEMRGSTFSITNYGSYNGYMGTPIINPPEVAIMGVGRIQDKPVVVNGQIEIRAMLPVSLSFDHRLVDGAAGEQFMERLKALLGNPNLLLMELR